MQLDALGYEGSMSKFIEFLRGKGVVDAMMKKLPHFGQDSDYFKSLVEGMMRIPSSNEAGKLLATAVFGTPAGREQDGTVIITSFNVAEPSSKTSQTKFAMLGDKKDNPLYVTDKKGTDKLVGKLISESGFLEYSELSKFFRSLRGGRQVSLTHKSNAYLRMDVEKPKEFEEKSESRTSYSYRIQTRLLPS